MIELKNVNIIYDNHRVLDDANLTLHKGQLTILKGESGSGKSSLLNYLSLERVFDGSYYFFGKAIHLMNEKQKDNYREKYIAYVNQFNSLINDYSVIDNLECISMLRYGKIKNEKINSLLSQFSLMKVKNRKVKRLSGGEKQRTAIACAILKDAELYLFDEPTSMLDVKSKTLIVKGIEDLVKRGKIVIVATHEEEFFDCDCLYTIEQGRLNLKKYSPSHLNEEKKNKKSYMKKALNTITSKYLGSQLLFTAIMIMVLGFCIGSVVENIVSTNASLKEVESNVEEIYNQELYVVNDTVDDEYDYNNNDSNFAISNEILEKISDIDNVSSVESFAYFPVSLEQFDKNGNFIQRSYDEMMTMVLKQNDNTINEIVFGKREDSTGEGLINGISSAIFAHYPHQQLESRCEVTDEGEGVYITKYLANELNLTTLDNHSIVVRFTVPVASIPGLYQYPDSQEQIFVRGMYNVYQEREFKIIGILTDTPVNTYTNYYQGDIYMSKEMMDEIQNECSIEYYDIIQQLASTKIRISDIAAYCPYEIYETTWDWSSAIVVIDDYSKIDDVVFEIEQLGDDIRANKVNYYGMVDEINNYDNIFKSTMSLYTITILLACCLGIIVIKLFIKRSRKNDYIYLQRNGISYQNIQKIEMQEAFIEASLVSVIATFIAVIKLSNQSKVLMNMGLIVSFDIVHILGIILISFILIYIGTLISGKINQRGR